MKNKLLTQLILLAFMTIMTSSSLANDSIPYIQNPRNPPKDAPRIMPTSFRVEASIGYNFQNWQTLSTNNALKPTQANWKNGHGQFAYGFDLNYLYTKNLALEIGWYSLANISFTSASGNGTLHPWLLYGSFKAIAHLTDTLSIFGKSGFSYNSIEADLTHGNKHTTYWGWISSVGIGYKLSTLLQANLQYSVQPGHFNTSTTSLPFDTPMLQILTVTLSYQI